MQEASTKGFWDGLAAPATVDWCEPNYAVSPYIAEFWNTTSSLWMTVLGLSGMLLLARRRRFHGMFGGLALVGLGSAAFHGTLLRPAQALDELPMVFLSLLGLWVVVHRGRGWAEGNRFAAALAGFAAVFSASYWNMPSAFLYFIMIYGGLVGWLTITSLRLTMTQEDARLKRLLLISATGYFGALLGCWIPEHVIFPCDHPVQHLHLHAWWHMLAGSGTFAFILWMRHLDRRARQQVAASSSPNSETLI